MFHLRLAPVLLVLSLGFQAQADFRSELRALHVGVVFPGDDQYVAATHRPYNLRFKFKPAAVTFPNVPSEVSSIVQVGARYGLKVVPRGGGHSYIDNSLGGMNGSLVVDMSHFKLITVHEDNTTATIETGNRLGDIALGLFQHGRAMPHGACPYVGIGGHATFGGFGFTSRMWGLALDVIESIDLVLANGTIATVSGTQHPQLFWAMRGAGSSYAISTALKVRTFRAPESGIIALDTWYLSATQAAKALSSFQSFVHTTESLPQYYGGEFVLSSGPSSGLLSVSLFSGFWGPQNEYNATVAPWKESMPFPPNSSTEDKGNYIDSLVARAGSTLDTTQKPDNADTFYVKSLIVPEVSGTQVGLSKKAWEALFDYLVNEGSNAPVGWFIEVELWGGQNSAITSLPLQSTSFAYRDMMWTLQMYSYSDSRLPPYPGAGFAFTDGIANSIIRNMPLGWEYGAYTNYIDNRLQNWQQLYYANHYPRLQRLKSEYDPLNSFDFPTAIQPSVIDV